MDLAVSEDVGLITTAARTDFFGSGAAFQKQGRTRLHVINPKGVFWPTNINIKSQAHFGKRSND